MQALSQEIFDLISGTGKTISTAESCSAGRIATILTSIPGCSTYVKGGLVCYMDEIKERLLHVDAELMEKHIAVCEEVSRQMVEGALELFKSDYSVAVTGFAGPDGGTEENPVGTIWIAVGSATMIKTRKAYFNFSREENTTKAVEVAMIMLRDFIKDALAE